MLSSSVRPVLGNGSSGPVWVVPELVLPALASAVWLLLAAAAWQPGQPRVGLGAGWGLAVAVSRLQLALA